MTENVLAADAFAALEADPEAVLVDVRAPVEWAAVGVPDLSTLGRDAVLLSWQVPPVLAPDPHFVDKMAAAVRPEQPVYFLCRSGVRSLAAGLAAEAAGFSRTFNVVGGFEGQAGWLQAGLPSKRG